MEPPTRIVRADFNGEGIVWLIIALVWFVAQIISKLGGKGKRPPLPPRPMTLPTNVEDTLREFLESLGGAAVEEKEAVPPPPPPSPVQRTPPPPPVTRRNTQSQGEYQRKLREKHRGQRAAESVPPIPLQPLSVQQAVGAELEHSQRAMKTQHIGTLSISMPSLKSAQLPIGGFGSLTRKADHRAISNRPNFKGRANFRKAIISRIILSPPKGMEGWKSSVISDP